MTAAAHEHVIAILLTDDVAEQQAIARRHELACVALRSAPTAELRTFYRLEVLRLEKEMVRT